MKLLCVKHETAVYETWNCCVWNMKLLCAKHETAVNETWNRCVWNMKPLCLKHETAVYETWNCRVWNMKLLCVKHETAVCETRNCCVWNQRIDCPYWRELQMAYLAMQCTKFATVFFVCVHRRCYTWRQDIMDMSCTSWPWACSRSYKHSTPQFTDISYLISSRSANKYVK